MMLKKKGIKGNCDFTAASNTDKLQALLNNDAVGFVTFLNLHILLTYLTLSIIMSCNLSFFLYIYLQKYSPFFNVYNVRSTQTGVG